MLWPSACSVVSRHKVICIRLTIGIQTIACQSSAFVKSPDYEHRRSRIKAVLGLRLRAVQVGVMLTAEGHWRVVHAIRCTGLRSL
eukprot:scaffold2298_cov388-Prasinococcus_capsulatus_cf.AAC.9